MKTLFAALIALTVTALAGPAAAYVGPGAGLSMVGAFWGLLIAILAAFGFIIVWPVRRLLKRSRAKADGAKAGADLQSDASESSKAQPS